MLAHANIYKRAHLQIISSLKLDERERERQREKLTAYISDSNENNLMEINSKMTGIISIFPLVSRTRQEDANIVKQAEKPRNLHTQMYRLFD